MKSESRCERCKAACYDCTPAALVGLVIRLAMLVLLTGDLIAEKRNP